MEEVWKDVVGYEGFYQISSLGRVKSLERVVFDKDGIRRFCTTDKILAQSFNTQGYPQVSLYAHGNQKNITVHRLVAETFISKPDSFSQVNHIDENKLNNAVSNLEWCTEQYNLNYGTRIKRSAEKRARPVMQMNCDGAVIRTFKSAREAHNKYGYSYKNISACCHGKKKSHAGYNWAFV